MHASPYALSGLCLSALLLLLEMPNGFYTLAQQWAGCIEDGADDMSFNKKYLEEYGQ